MIRLHKTFQNYTKYTHHFKLYIKLNKSRQTIPTHYNTWHNATQLYKILHNFFLQKKLHNTLQKILNTNTNFLQQFNQLYTNYKNFKTLQHCLQNKRLHKTLHNCTKLYKIWTKLLTNLYNSLQYCTQLYRNTLQKNVHNFATLYRTLQNSTQLYQTLQNYPKLHKIRHHSKIVSNIQKLI